MHEAVARVERVHGRQVTIRYDAATISDLVYDSLSVNALDDSLSHSHVPEEVRPPVVRHRVNAEVNVLPTTAGRRNHLQQAMPLRLSQQRHERFKASVMGTDVALA